MNKNIERQCLIAQLEELPTSVLAMALLVSKDMYKHGVVITDKWSTAVQNHENLEKAYINGLQRGRELEHEDMSKLKNYIDTDIAQTKYLLNTIYGKPTELN